MPATDTRQSELETALANLVNQVDIADYRDSKGHGLKNNLSFIQAQALVDAYGLTHERICWALEACGGDAKAAARKLAA